MRTWGCAHPLEHNRHYSTTDVVDTGRFEYTLDPGRIAQRPAQPRDSARLLYTPDLSDHRFSDLPALLRPDDLVVINTTRVRPARLSGTRVDTGGGIELLLLDQIATGEWEALIRPARRIRAGVVIDVAGAHFEVRSDPVDGRVLVATESDVEATAAAHGAMPLPPYIVEQLAQPDDYQTVYAQVPGSAAAPTAGLHFTKRGFDGLMRRGIDIAEVDLHVGLGTFRPITTKSIEDHHMHTERYFVSARAAAQVSRARHDGRRIVAIGTTVVRTLESAVKDGDVREGPGSTDLFIKPGFSFSVVDVLVTNFHIPRSSLIVMVAAFMGDGWRTSYDAALARGYRFLSFGDAMLAERL